MRLDHFVWVSKAALGQQFCEMLRAFGGLLGIAFEVACPLTLKSRAGVLDHVASLKEASKQIDTGLSGRHVARSVCVYGEERQHRVNFDIDSHSHIRINHMGTRPRQLVTRQRTEILRALQHADAFLTAAELHSSLLSKGVRASLSTVYRSLEMLVEAGLVDAVRDEESSRYRMCAEDRHHHHLRCRRCHRSIELVDEEIERWASAVARRHRYTDVSHHVELIGECNICRGSRR